MRHPALPFWQFPSTAKLWEKRCKDLNDEANFKEIKMKSKTGAAFGSFERSSQSSISFGRKLLFIGVVALALGATAEAFAKGGVGGGGGTAKPPAKNLVSGFPVTALPTPAAAIADACVGIGGCVVGTGLNGFDVTGFMQDATVAPDNSMCPRTPNPVNGAPNLLGGTVKINGVTITIPCNTIVQMPANTFTWADFINAAQGTDEWDSGSGKIKGFKTSGSGSPQQYEIQVVGNTVGTTNIGALVYVSQQMLHSGSGVITSIDYSTGRIHVANGLGGTSVVEINDPNGRFGRPQSPDSRFSVDDQNPTIHSGTGYPMCVPRTDPAVANDPLCPQKNRPRVATGCRNYTQAGLVVLPKSGELAPPVAADVFCKAFVMNPVTTTAGMAGVVLGIGNPLSTSNGNAALPDARQQAPFEVGDFIAWAGTLFDDGSGSGTDYVSAHTIEANVGIFTQPGTQPAYVSIGEFGMGPVDPPPAPAAGLPVNFNGVAAEATNRFFLEASTTDVVTPVDIYYMDVNDPRGVPYHADGSPRNRWVSPFGMTGECDPAPVVAPVGGVLGGTCLGVEGGITTQFSGPQNMRARIRAIKPPTLLLNRPSRYVRVVQRSLCAPSQIATVNALGVPVVDAAGDQLINTTAQDACITAAYTAANNNAATHANGLVNGTYLAPVFEYIFPENTQTGQPIIPNDFWDLPFLRYGEGNPATGGVGPLEPVPW